MGSPITISSFEIFVYNNVRYASINNGVAYIILADTTYPPKELCFLSRANNRCILYGYKNGREQIRQPAFRNRSDMITCILNKPVY